jgi:hypothetical protein
MLMPASAEAWRKASPDASKSSTKPYLLRADHLPRPGRQCTANLKAAKIAGAGHNHRFD